MDVIYHSYISCKYIFLYVIPSFETGALKLSNGELMGDEIKIPLKVPNFDDGRYDNRKNV